MRTFGGDPRFDRTRISVAHVYRRSEGGETPKSIAAGYDGVSVADVHAALAYAFDNPDELRGIERRAHDAVEYIRGERPADPERSQNTPKCGFCPTRTLDPFTYRRSILPVTT